VPIIATERLVTTVTVANRNTVVLGGLITENEEKSTSGIPLLSRLPVVGHAFKTTKTTKARKELLIFIQPVVVEDADQAYAASGSEERRTEIAGDAAATFPDPPIPVFKHTVVERVPAAETEAKTTIKIEHP
jgi:type II secretory pathway component GspD/PulD (secretin)